MTNKNKQTIEIPTLEYLLELFNSEDEYRFYWLDRREDSKNKLGKSKDSVYLWAEFALHYPIARYWGLDKPNKEADERIERLYREKFIPKLLKKSIKT